MFVEFAVTVSYLGEPEAYNSTNHDPSENESTLTEKKLLPKYSKFFSFKVNPFFRRDETVRLKFYTNPISENRCNIKEQWSKSLPSIIIQIFYIMKYSSCFSIDKQTTNS